jgi:hypothetical protein
MNNRIQKFDPDGGYLAQFGAPGNGDGEFNAPYVVQVSASGDVFVLDTGNFRVQQFEPV